MPAKLLDGNQIAATIKAEIVAEVRAMTAADLRPGLAVVMAGNDPASEIYLEGKVRACQEAGILSEKHALPANVSTRAMVELVEELNRSEDIDGILVNLPLPPQVDYKTVQMAVDPAKDVDGFHPVNIGFLSTHRPGLVPCTPAGIIEILERSQIPMDGAEAVVVGRSDIVGKPTTMLLLNHNATVTVCHSHTRELAAVCRRADILIAAIGEPGIITRDHVKPGATVIDVGVNRITDRALVERFFSANSPKAVAFARRGSVVMGDVHPEVAELAGALTPVPGGVGPLTVVMLMVNTLRAARARHALAQSASAEASK